MLPTENQKRDYRKYFVSKGQKNFSPDRNKDIVDEVIRENELKRKRNEKDYVDKLRERTDAVAQYLHKLASGSTYSVDRYFGKRELAKLRGQKIVAELKGRAKKLLEVSSI